MAYSPTPDQQKAIDCRDKTLLVSAAAGAGKTGTLTARVLASLLDRDHPADLSRMLIATFTTASAADLRVHIGDALRAAMADRPNDKRLALALAGLPYANISTLDSYFVKLLRAHAELAEIPSDFRIADEAEASLLQLELLEELIGDLYEGRRPDVADPLFFARAVEHLTSPKTSRAELPRVFLSLYHIAANYPEGAGVYFRFAELLREAEQTPFSQTPWGQYILKETEKEVLSAAALLATSLDEFRQGGGTHPALEDLISAEIELYKNIADLTKSGYTPTKNALDLLVYASLPGKSKTVAPALSEDRSAAKDAVKALRDTFYVCPEATLSETLPRLTETVEMLARFTDTFDRAYLEAQRARRFLDFASLERVLLSILRDTNGDPTPCALHIRESLDYLYIDEYQDINPIQHAILVAIAKEGTRFMVGDLKQSIYSFRRAAPTIFADMKATFPHLDGAEGSCATLHLSKNFRSDAEVLAFINQVFDLLFGRVGRDIGYACETDRLVAGRTDSDGRAARPRVVLAQKPDPAFFEAYPALAELSKGRVGEALYVGDTILRMMEETDEEGKPLYTWGSFAIIGAKHASLAPFVPVLEAMGIPVDQGKSSDDFFLCPEVMLAMSLLHAIDNPLRDVHLAAVMLSPLFGFTADELAILRRDTDCDLPLWLGLKTYLEEHPDHQKGRTLVESLTRLRAISESLPLDRLIRRILTETGLLALAGREEGGRQKLLRLYEYARRFQGSSYRGLFSFIDYLSLCAESGKKPEEPSSVELAQTDRVHLMTIHSSKGLEFPVTFVIGAGASMRGGSDAKSPLLFHERLGMSLTLSDDTGLARVDNPLRQAILHAATCDRIRESMRVLYVALTRAKRRLFVVASPVGKASAEHVMSTASRLHRCPTEAALLGAPSFFSLVVAATGTEAVEVIDPAVAMPPPLTVEPQRPAQKEADPTPAPAPLSEEELAALLRRRFSFVYPHSHLATLPEKLSVSRLSPDLLDGTEEEETSLTQLIAMQRSEAVAAPEDSASADTQKSEGRYKAPAFIDPEEGSATDRGIATHLFMQFCDFDRLAEEGVLSEMDRLLELGILSDRDVRLIRTEELERFAASPCLGMLREAETLYREQRFHVTLPAAALTEDETLREKLKDERVLVQGVIDCVAVGKDGSFFLLDYKTDRLTWAERKDPALAEQVLRERHGAQLTYYADAALRIWGRRPRTYVYALHTGLLYPVD